MKSFYQNPCSLLRGFLNYIGNTVGSAHMIYNLFARMQCGGEKALKR